MRLFLLVLILFALACGQSTVIAQPSMPVASIKTVVLPTPTIPIPTLTPQVFDGNGQKAIAITLQPGLVVAKMTHNGTSNFAVTVLNEAGQLDQLLANVIGAYNGSQAFHADGGVYALDITADGTWHIEINQPAPVSPSSLPLTLTGHGPMATDFFTMSGLTTFELGHQGNSNFAVVLLDTNGEMVDLLANEIGSFTGSTATGGTGIYLLDIQADGDWQVTIK